MVEDVVLEVVPLGGRLAAVDPFVFAVHHRDAYPRGNDRLGPDAPLGRRELGMDFSGADGWSMYHGSVVPGFPQHPHRGFETVTFVRSGVVDHCDSLGATARFGRGDVQWLTAGSGIVHCEMFPLLERASPNPLELFQIWLNLPAGDKMVEPYFTMQWDEEVPRLAFLDEAGRPGEVTVIAGGLRNVRPLAPPPHSYASHTEADVAIWHVVLSPDAVVELPPARSSATARTLYVVGGSIEVAARPVASVRAVRVRAEVPLEAVAGHAGAEVLVLQGRPIGEPVVQYGPFVMNDRAGIERAILDYRRTGFGGWPWPSDDPVQAREAGRFALHADGTVERRAVGAATPPR